MGTGLAFREGSMQVFETCYRNHNNASLAGLNAPFRVKGIIRGFQKLGKPLVGTLRENKQEIPYSLLDKKIFSSGQSAFAFSTDVTRVAFASSTCKIQKNWFVLSLQCIISQ